MVQLKTNLPAKLYYEVSTIKFPNRTFWTVFMRNLQGYDTPFNIGKTEGEKRTKENPF